MFNGGNEEWYRQNMRNQHSVLTRRKLSHHTVITRRKLKFVKIIFDFEEVWKIEN